MASVIGLQRDVQTKWEIDSSRENLLNEHMSKIIKWAVLDFKKKYPLLFNREYTGGRRPKYEWEELLAFDIYCVYNRECPELLDFEHLILS